MPATEAEKIETSDPFEKTEPEKPVRGEGRPSKKGYRTKDGKRVPSVTTVLGRFKEAGGLIHWAWSLGIEGEDYRQARDAAADAGSITHDWVEDTVHGTPLREFPNAAPETIVLARTALDAFRDWVELNEVKWLATEFPLVSETHRFGGTPDALALVRGKRYLLDWKSSNRVYGEHVCQVGAYRALMLENGMEDVAGAMLLRFGKEFAEFTQHHWPIPAVELGWNLFLHLRAAYDLDQRVKKIAA
jgi:hypothetical protein